MTEKLMDIKQVAEYLQMNKMTVYKLAKEGRIPAFKVASEWRFRKDLIESWLMSKVQDRQITESITFQTELKEGRTVLVVDDDEAILDFFERVLKDYNFLKAASGEAALQIIKKKRPDLVLLDLRMPGLDGIETLKRIKKYDSTIPVIMLSAYGSLEINMIAARLGAFASMSKPFDLPAMKKIISESMDSEHAEKTAETRVKPSAIPKKKQRKKAV